MPPLLHIDDVSKSFTVRQGLFSNTPAKVLAVNGVSLELASGETLGLVGESGCGKSTLARIVVGLEAASSGNIILEGRPVTEWSAMERAGLVQMVFQDPFSSLNPRMRVGESIAEPQLLRLRQQEVSRTALREQVRALLAKVGLDPEYESRYPHEFSGGQRQRIAVARALMAGAKLLVCDEAVSAQDASVQAQVLNLLKDIQEQHALTYLFISHDLGVVGFMSSRVAVMYLGRIVELAPRENLFESPAHPYTMALMAAAPVRDPANRGKHTPLPGELPSPLDPPPGCAFHPRCPRKRPICSEIIPPLTEYGPEHLVRCHFPG